MSQEARAHRAGVHRTHVSDIELDKLAVTIETAKRLTDALHVPVSGLTERAEKLSE